ncbi:MAG: phosphatase PAP2 family protein [Bacillota bacterium]|jgi:undecaprenyl-diphosphatase
MEIIQSWDMFIVNFINTNLHSFIGDFLMILFSRLGSGGLIWIAAALLLLISKQYRFFGALLLISLLLSVVFSEGLLKNIIARDRPFIANPQIKLLIPPLDSFSLPSSHAVSSFAAAFIVRQVNKNLGLIAYIMATIIAFSRIYLAMHYPTDVIIGFLLGTGIAFIVYTLFNQLMKKRLPDIHNLPDI